MNRSYAFILRDWYPYEIYLFLILFFFILFFTLFFLISMWAKLQQAYKRFDKKKW